MGCPPTELEVVVVVVVVVAAAVVIGSSSSSSRRKVEYTSFCEFILHVYCILVTLQG
jgi:type II secretory pathway pseudopilin PulG